MQDLASPRWVGEVEGKSHATVVRRPNTDTRYLSKGVDFVTLLETPKAFELRRKVCYHEIRTIRALPKKANTVSPATIFVIATKKRHGE